MQNAFLSGGIADVLRSLWTARRFAELADGDAWKLAAPRKQLEAVGADAVQLQWLIDQQFVEHRIEVTAPSDPSRVFLPSDNYAMNESSCFVLTARGSSWAKDVLNKTSDLEPLGSAIATNLAHCHQTSAENGQKIRPRWDAELRELRVGEILIKRFRQPAPNQEAILAAFDEEGWPPRVDDPLPPASEIDPAQRLRDTIRSLNQRQRTKLLRFQSDGRAEGVHWTMTEQMQMCA